MASKASIRFPAPEGSIDARVMDLGTAVLILPDGQLLPLAAEIALKVEMAQSQSWQEIPTRLSVEEFEHFVWPHLSTGRRGPARKLSAHTIDERHPRRWNGACAVMVPACPADL